MASETDDPALLMALTRGDRAAGACLVRRHHGSMARFARALIGQDADDIVQQAWMDAIRGGSTFHGRCSVRSWLLTLTRNAAHRSRRLRSGQPREFVPLEVLALEAGWGSNPEESVSRSLDAERLAAALGRLHPDAREVLILRDIEGLTGAEVASMLGITLPATKSRLHRARLELTAAVRKEFGHGP